MKRLVIYTCITGAYDTLLEPLAVNPDAEYVCFTDADIKRQVWKVRPIVHREKNALMTARWHKLNPYLLFPDYEYSLWVDGNVIPASEGLYTCLDDLMSRKSLWAGIRHPQRDDLYEEAYRILANGRESVFKLMRICAFLSKESMPRHWGLMETNVMLRAHNRPEVVNVDGLWCHLLEKYTHRDQMLQTYCLWKTGLSAEYLLPKGYSARNHDYFLYVNHDKPYVKDKSIKGRLRDLRIALRKLFFRLFLALYGIGV